MRIVVCVTVKAFLAQAKEEFTKKWDEPPQVRGIVSILVTNCEFADLILTEDQPHSSTLSIKLAEMLMACRSLMPATLGGGERRGRDFAQSRVHCVGAQPL